MDTVMVFVGTVFLAYVVGRWRERLRWEDACQRGEPVQAGGIGYRVMRENVYQHLLADRGDPAAGCCCEETPIEYRSHNEE